MSRAATNSSVEKILGVVLAAGEGKRFGGPKAPYVYQGRRLVDIAVENLREAGIVHVLVVAGAWEGEVPGATVISNSEWKSGMSSSLASAIQWAEQQSGFDAVLVTLVDLPHLKATTIREILEVDGELVQPRYAGVPGHPVKISRAHWTQLLEALDGDEGARGYLGAHSDLLRVIEFEEAAPGIDLDRPL